MDFAATQVYEDEDAVFSQENSHASEEESEQVGTLRINSIDYMIKKGITTIGRNSSCDITIHDMSVSRLHAEIEAGGGKRSTWICHLNLQNRTKLNNLTLQPKRSYELKDRSVIEFGRVRAIYRTYCPADDIMIPETPAPQQKIMKAIIPNTPDSSLNNSSSDGSIIFGTQKDDESSVFRRPRAPPESPSTSTSKKSAFTNKSNDSHAVTLHTSDINVSKNQVSIHDVETQKFDEGYNTASDSIYDEQKETQGDPTDVSKRIVEANAKAGKELPKLNVHNKTSGGSVSDIHDVETQNCVDDITEMETQKSRIDIRSVAEKEFTTDVYTMETQAYVNDTDEGGNDAQKSEIGKATSQEKSLGKIRRDIHDLDTQRLDDKYVAEDIANLETQLVLGSVARCENRDMSDMETQLEANSTANKTTDNQVNKDNSQKKSLNKIGHNVHDLDTQRFDDKYIAEDIADLETQVELGSVARCEQNRDISDMETQLVTNGTANETTDNRVNKDQDKNVTGNDKINYENVTNSPKSRSSSPRSLNLSSPGVDGDCPLPSLDESCHLLESSDLLEFFTAGIDRQDVAGTSNMSTPKPLTKVSSKRNNVENVANDEEDNDEDIFNAPTQSARCKFEALLSDDSNEEDSNALVMGKAPKKKLGVPQSKQINDDSETDAEEYVVELAKKQSKSSRTLNESSNEDVSNRNDPGTSIESEDMFDVQTQPLGGHKDTLNSSINQPQKTNEVNEAEVDRTVPTKIIRNVDQNNRTSTLTPDINDAATQLVLSCETSSKTIINSRDFVSKNNQNDTDDVANTHIINAKSVDCCTTENLDSEDIDYEFAPTQIIGKSEDKEKRNPTCERGSSEINDTLEQKLTEMFADVDNDMNSIRDPPHMSTQENLENILESSDYNYAANTSAADDRDTGNIPQNQIGIKNHTSCNEKNLPDTKVNANNVNKAESDSQNSDVNFSITTRRKKRILKTTELVETDSQSSDIYFSTIVTRRKRNILRDTPELEDPAEDTAPSIQDVHIPQASEINEKTIDDNVAVESNKGRKKISKTKNKSDAITEVSNDNNVDNIISNENNERRSQSSNSMKQKDEAALVTNKQNLRSNLADAVKSNVDNAEENASICIPCPSRHGQRVQTLDTLYENDDDILVRLPAVRISGTLSNPASPSASSTSPVRSIDTSDDSDNETKYKRFQQMAGRMLGNNLDCLNQQNRESRKGARVSPGGSEYTKNTNIEVKYPTRVSSRTTRHSRKQSNQSSHDADKEACVNNTAYAAAIFTESETKSTTVAKRKTSLNVTEERMEQLTSKKRKTAGVPEECPVSTRNRRGTMKTAADRQSPNNLEHFTKTSSRESSSENVKSSKDDKSISKINQIIEERSVSTRSRRNTMKTAANRQSPNLLEHVTKTRSCESSSENVKSSEDNKSISKTAQVTEERPVSARGRRNAMKTAADRQSPNLLEHITKTRSRENFSENNVKSSEDDKAVSKTTLEETQEISLHTRIDGNVDSGRANVKRTRRMIYDSQVTTHVNDVAANENGKNDKPVQTKGTDTQASQSHNKVLRVILSPIKNPSNDSQEVERIMARGSNNTQDKNLSIRESNKAKIFKRELRNRSKKQTTSDSETGSTLTESSMSSEIEDSDNTQLDNSGPKSKRQKSGKSVASSLLDARVVIEKQTFKRPIRVKQNSSSPVLDSSIEKMTGENSDTSTSSTVSRSKTANTRKKKKMESNIDSLTDKSASTLDTSAEITSFAATPSRARRNTSSLSSSTPSAMRHKILFTGITEDYSKTVKTLGGSKVEDTANCTVLVTDKVRRTYKFLCALAKGIPIVAIDWLRDSKTAGQFLDWENYILKDPAAEAKFAFRLRKSLDKAKEKKLLDSWTVVLTPGVAPPPIDELKEIVLSCGGKALVRPPAKWPERAVVLSREEDLPNARKFLAKAPKTVTVQDTEFILTGILRQETDFVKYKLK